MIVQPKTILNVDDSPASRRATSLVLRHAGFRVQEAQSGREALRLAQTHPDLILLDVQLPDLDGFEVCRRLKADPLTNRIPILHLSGAYTDSHHRAAGLEGGADGYLLKPVDPKELVAQVRALIRIKIAEEAARLAAQDWQATFDSLSDGVCLLDRTGVVLRCNRALAELLGKPVEQLVGHSYRDLVRQALGAALPEAVLPAEPDGPVVQEFPMPGRWFRATITPVPAVEGGDSRTVHVLSDLTPHKRQERLRDANYAVARVLAESRRLAEVAPRILRLVAEALSWDVGVFWIVDEGELVLRCTGVWKTPGLDIPDFEEDCWRQAFAPGQGLPGSTWARKEPIWVPDFPSAPEYRRMAQAARQGLHGALNYPLLLGGSVLGVLEFFSTQERQPDENVLLLLRSLSSQLGQFIERRWAEDAVGQSEARKARILATALDAVVTTDHHGRILEFNPAAERLFGHSQTEAVDKMITELLLDPSWCEGPGRILANCLAAGGGPLPESRLELPARRADGSAFPVEAALTHFEAGGMHFLTGFFRDLTELRQAQGRALQAERLAAIGEMATGLAHESRNALQGIQACVGLLQPKLADRPEALDLLERLQQEQDRLHRLNEDVRDYAAPIRLDYRVISLAEAWRQAWASLRRGQPARDLLLREVLEAESLVCEGDPFHLEQVFRNILDNALGACPGAVRIDLRCRAADLAGRPALRVAVRDNGPGLDAEQRRRIFEPFYTTKTQGTGLGMTISKRLVEAHGGELAVGPGGPGAEILLTLPRRRS